MYIGEVGVKQEHLGLIYVMDAIVLKHGVKGRFRRYISHRPYETRKGIVKDDKNPPSQYDGGFIEAHSPLVQAVVGSISGRGTKT